MGPQVGLESAFNSPVCVCRDLFLVCARTRISAAMTLLRFGADCTSLVTLHSRVQLAGATGINFS